MPHITTNIKFSGTPTISGTNGNVVDLIILVEYLSSSVGDLADVDITNIQTTNFYNGTVQRLLQ